LNREEEDGLSDSDYSFDGSRDLYEDVVDSSVDNSVGYDEVD
jgi:hypothetical protein